MPARKITEIVRQIEENKKSIEIMPTGILYLDATIDGGFIKKEFIVLGGKTGGGKSLLAGNIFLEMAKNGQRSAYFSLEISSEMLASRLIGARADVSPARMMIHELAKPELEATDKAEAEIATYEEFMYFYDDTYYIEEIIKEIEEQKYDFVVIDFLQNIMTKHKEEYERLSSVALTLQKLAKSANCCILGVSQLSNVMARDKKNTDIVEFKGSGAIGHAADLAFFIEAGRAGENSLSLRLRKNRRGVSNGSFSFMIKQPGGRIVEIS